MADETTPSELVNALVRPSPIKRGSILPFSQQGDQAFLDVPFPAASHAAWDAIKNFMGSTYHPGTQDQQSVNAIERSADVAREFAGATAPRAAGEAVRNLQDQVARDRLVDALGYHMRQIGHDEGGWTSRAAKAAFASTPLAVEGAFAPFQGDAAPWMLGTAGATTAAAAYAFLRPHYDMLMKKRQYLRDMDERLAKEQGK